MTKQEILNIIFGEDNSGINADLLEKDDKYGLVIHGSVSEGGLRVTKLHESANTCLSYHNMICTDIIVYPKYVLLLIVKT